MTPSLEKAAIQQVREVVGKRQRFSRHGHARDPDVRARGVPADHRRHHDRAAGAADLHRHADARDRRRRRREHHAGLGGRADSRDRPAARAGREEGPHPHAVPGRGAGAHAGGRGGGHRALVPDHLGDADPAGAGPALRGHERQGRPAAPHLGGDGLRLDADPDLRRRRLRADPGAQGLAARPRRGAALRVSRRASPADGAEAQTSQSVTASRSEVSGSRVGTNSWAT